MKALNLRWWHLQNGEAYFELSIQRNMVYFIDFSKQVIYILEF